MRMNSCDHCFEILSSKLRLLILVELINGSKTVNELCKLFKEEQSNVSHSLKRLRECNFISYKKNGKRHVYQLSNDTFPLLINLMETHIKKNCPKCNHSQ